jgi:hypothetical protein
MADLNQLYEALRKADAAGDTAGAKRLAEYIQQLQAAPIEPPQEPTKDTGFFDMTGRAIVRGAKQTGSLLGDVLPAMAARAVGADEYAARQMEEAAETQREIEQKYGARYKELSDVKGLGDVLPFVAETVAEQIPNIATAIVPGVGGAALGSRMAAQQALKTAAGREAAEAAATRYAAQAATKGAVRGGGAGAFLGSYALNAPEVFQNIYTGEETEGQMELGASLLAGSVAAALDSILPAALVRQFTPGMKAGVVEKILERSGMPPGIARGATAGAVTGAVTEGPTEAAQEAISIAAEKFVADNASAWGSKEFNRLVESGVRGAVGGGGISGTAGAIKGIGQRRPAEETGTEFKDTTAFDQLDLGFTEEDTDEGTGTIPGARERGVPVSGGQEEVQRQTAAGAAATEGRGVGAVGESPNVVGGGTGDVGLALSEQIQTAQQYIQDLKRIDPADPRIEEASAYMQDLQARERALRRGDASGALAAQDPQFGGIRKLYKLSPTEAAVTRDDLMAAGFFGHEADRILYNAKNNKGTAYAKDVLRRVAEGQIKFGTELRPVAPTDLEAAQTPEERQRLEAALARKGTQQPLLAKEQQLGLDLTMPEGEVERNLPSLIEMGEPEFVLERPAGIAPERVEIESPETQAAPFDFGKRSDQLYGFLNNLQSSAEADQGVTNYKSAVKNFIDEIQEYIGSYGTKPDQRNVNQQQVNDFFNQFSLIDDPQAAANFASDMAGKSATEQAQMLKSRTKMPDITTLRGLNELRTQFRDFMTRRKAETLGYTEEQAATESFGSDTRIPARVSRILNALRLSSEKSRSPEEQAAYNYFSQWNYGLAMRSAAFDLAYDTPKGDMFSGQGGDQAKLFRAYVEENFPAQTLEAFDRTVDRYKYEMNKSIGNIKALNEYRRKIKDLEKSLDKSEAELQKLIKETPLSAPTPINQFKPMHPAVVAKLEQNDLNGALDVIRRSVSNRYYKALGQRLLDLNLPTSIYVGKARDLVNTNVQTVKATFDSLMQDLRDLYPDVYNKYFNRDLSDPIYVINSLEQIAYTKEVPEAVIKGLKFELVREKYKQFVPALNSPGAYFPAQDSISLNQDEFGLSYYTFFHEVVHAATAHLIRNPDKLEPAQRRALDELTKIYNYAKTNYGSKLEVYGFTNLDEFIAEAFSNDKFQVLLRSIKYPSTEQSLWSRFVRFIAQLIGGTDSALFATFANADILMSSTISRDTTAFPLTGSLTSGATPGKRKSVYSGTFKPGPVPTDVGISRRFLDFLSERPTWNAVKGNVGAMLDTVGDTTRKYYLGAFTLRQLQDLIGGRLGDSARNFIEAIESMMEARNAILDQVSKITKDWERYQSAHPNKSKDLSLVMIDSTLQGIDPSIDAKGNAALKSAWDNLDATGKQLYVRVRDFYKARVEEYKATLLRNIELSMIGQGKTAAEIAAVKKELTKKFEEDSIQPYFPLKRFGRFWLQIGEGQNKEFYMFDSAGQRNAFREQRRVAMERNKDSRVIFDGNDMRSATSKNLQDLSILSEIEKIVDGATGNDSTALRENIKDSVEQLYYLTLPNKSVRKMFINRKQVSGASQDMLRAFVDSSFHMAYQQSRFKYARTMFEQLNAADQLRKERAKAGVEGATADSDYVAELERRLEYVMNPTDTGAIPSILSNVSFLWYLTAPASALVNMLGVPAIGFPVLSARFGKTKAAGTLLGYSKKFLSSGFRDAEGNLSMPSVGNSALDPTEKAAYDIFVSSGLIDITQSHDLAGIAEAPSTMYTGKMNTIMKAFSAMFHHAERFNREVMAMSAFRMAYDSAIKGGDSKEVAFKRAVDQAKDLTYRSMFDYSTLNKPRYLQNAYAKVILQFKQFPQQMTYLLTRSGFEWMDKPTEEQIGQIRDNIIRERARYGQTTLSAEGLEEAVQTEIKRIRQEGRDRLLGTLGMTFLFAGATGMPLFSVGSSVIEAMYAVFSDDDEPPLDFENWFKNWMAQTFGDTAGDAMTRGLVTTATGMNFADRMSLNDLWFRDSRKSQDEVTAFQNMIINLLGPTAALGVSGAEAVKLFNDGHYYRGAEKILPAVFKQPMVAARYSTEGVLTLKGDELVSDISAKDALAQSLGFAPEKVSQRQKANIEMKGMEQDIISKRTDLMNAFFMAVDTQDDDFKDRVIDKIARFNQTYPMYPITATGLRKSIKTRMKARGLASVTGGIPINKNLIATLQDMGYYGEEQ